MSFNFNLQSIQQQLSAKTQQLGSTISENLNNLNLQETTQSLTTNFSKEVGNLKPIFQRTTRSLQEKFGSIEDISELPQEYKDLEKKIDNLKTFYKKTLIITQQYEIESYDYPPNLRESFQDYSKFLSEKISGLSQATTTSEAEAVLLATSKDSTPKTLNHQLSKSFKTSRDLLLSSSEEESENSLTKSLLKISETEYRVGDERLDQDKLIITEFNAKIKKLLTVDFVNTGRLRKNVETSRLSFDTIRAEIKLAQKGDESAEIPESLSKKLEASEDDLVNATELAVASMKDLIKPLESISLIKIFAKIQLNYHKAAVSELSSLVDELETLPVDEE